jgi:hypothetical protein
MCSESRKIFRFLSTIQEIKRIIDKLNYLKSNNKKTSIIFDIISRIGYLIYWGFDNLYVISVLRKFSKNTQLKYFFISKTGWFFANLISILKNLYDIFLLKNSNLNKIKNQNYNNSLDIYNNNDIDLDIDNINNSINELDNKGIMKKINDEIFLHKKEILARFCDLLISAHYLEIPERFFNLRFTDGILSIAGMISSCII